MVEAFGKFYAYEQVQLIWKSRIQSFSNGDPGRTILIHIDVSARRNPGDNMNPMTVPQRNLEKQAVAE